MFLLPVEPTLSLMQVTKLVGYHQSRLLDRLRLTMNRPIGIPKFVSQHETAKFGNLALKDVVRMLIHDQRVGALETLLGRDYFHPLVLSICQERFGSERVLEGGKVNFILDTAQRVYHVRQNMGENYNADQSQAIAMNLRASKLVDKKMTYRVRIFCRGRKQIRRPDSQRPYWSLYGADVWEFLVGDRDAHKAICNYEGNEDFADVAHRFLYSLDEPIEQVIKGLREYDAISDWGLGEKINVTVWNEIANDSTLEWVEEWVEDSAA